MPPRNPQAKTRKKPSKTTTQRGYGYAHQQERKRLAPIVASGQAYCMQPICIHADRWIPPDSKWALGHNSSRTAWIGHVHADCNQLDGASRGGKTIAARKHPQSQTPAASQDW